MATKKSPEQLLNEFQNNGHKGKTPEQAIELLNACGFKVKVNGGKSTATRGNINLASLGLGGKNLPTQDYSNILRACFNALEEESAKSGGAITTSKKITETIIFPEAPEFAVSFEYDAHIPQIQRATIKKTHEQTLKEFVTKYNDRLAEYEKNYKIIYTRNPDNKTVAISASDAGVERTFNYIKVTKHQDIVDWTKNAVEEIAAIYIERDEKLEQLKNLGATITEKNSIRTCKTGKEKFTITCFGCNCIDRETSSKIDSAISQILQEREQKAANPLKARKVKQETGSPTGFVEGVVISKTITGGNISPASVKAKETLLELIMMAKNVTTKEEALSSPRKDFSCNEQAAKAYFDPDYKSPPQYSKRADVGSLKNKLLKFLEDNKISKKELKAAEKAFKQVKSEMAKKEKFEHWER